MEEDFQQRTIEDHDDDVEVAAQRLHGDPATGIRNSCSLNTLRNFHCITNYNLDIMHDMLEGVCPYEVKLLLHQFIFVDNFISVAALNQRLRSFSYAFSDRKNKPSALGFDRLRTDNLNLAKFVVFSFMEKLQVGFILSLLKCSNVMFFTHFHAYGFRPSHPSEYTVIQLHKLVDHLPLSCLRSYEKNSPQYLCPRYAIIQPRYLLKNDTLFHEQPLKMKHFMF